jgi:hypothetical protein
MTVTTDSQHLLAPGDGDHSKLPRWMSYKSGDLDAGKKQITEIVHQSVKGAIYLTAGDNITWDEEPNLGRHWHRASAEAIYLLTPAKITIKDPLERNRVLKMLAAVLRELYTLSRIPRKISWRRPASSS